MSGTPTTAEIQTAAQNLVYVSDGTRGSEKLATVLRGVPALLGAAEAVERVRALHEGVDRGLRLGMRCASCCDTYGVPLPDPCPTIRALDGEAS